MKNLEFYFIRVHSDDSELAYGAVSQSQSAELLAKVMRKVKTVLKVPSTSVHYCSNSTVVL